MGPSCFGEARLKVSPATSKMLSSNFWISRVNPFDKFSKKAAMKLTANEAERIKKARDAMRGDNA